MSDDKLSDDDKALFQQMMAAVKPLKSLKKKAPAYQAPVNILRSPKPVLPKEAPTITPYLSNHYNDTVTSETILSYDNKIPQKRLTQLKTGKIPWQARLDLHGLRPDAARESLCHFIEEQIRLENRCLLIIHGKGGQHFDAPVLKNHVNHWLQQMPQILAFHSALPRDGGSGALYVLLQHQR